MTTTKLISQLQQIVATTYTVLLQSQNFHWHVRGSNFHSWHEFYEAMYDELFKMIDEQAEKIVILGGHAPVDFAEIAKMSPLKVAKPTLKAPDMAKKMLTDLEQFVCPQLVQGIELAQELGNETAADLMIGNLEYFEKTAWMLRAHLDQ